MHCTTQMPICWTGRQTSVPLIHHRALLYHTNNPQTQHSTYTQTETYMWATVHIQSLIQMRTHIRIQSGENVCVWKVRWSNIVIYDNGIFEIENTDIFSNFFWLVILKWRNSFELCGIYHTIEFSIPLNVYNTLFCRLVGDRISLPQK